MRWMFTGILVLFVVALVPVTGAEEAESLIVEAPVQSLDVELTPEPVELSLPLSPTSCDTTADGSIGEYYCTGGFCYNGQKCARCCTAFETNCGPIECVDMCLE